HGEGADPVGVRPHRRAAPPYASGLQAVGVVVLREVRGGGGRQVDRAGLLKSGQHAQLDLVHEVRSGGEELDRLLLALTQPRLPLREPRTRLLHHIQDSGHLHQITKPIDTPTEHDVNLSLTERRRHLVLRHLHPRPRTNPLSPHLHITLTPHLKTHAGIELQSPTPRRRLRIPVQHPDLLPDLIDEDRRRTTLRQHPSQLPKRLRHQPRLQPNVRIPHLTLDLSPRHQRSHRIHHHHINRARPHQQLHDLKRLLTRIRLRHQQVLNVHTQRSRIHRIQRMLSINERSHTPNTLRLSHDMQSQRRLTPRLRPIHLNDPTPRHTTNPKRQIHRQRPRTDHTRPHELRRPRPQTHDRALTELPLDLRDSRVYGPR